MTTESKQTFIWLALALAAVVLVTGLATLAQWIGART
jgi:hypothetical protein